MIRGPAIPGSTPVLIDGLNVVHARPLLGRPVVEDLVACTDWLQEIAAIPVVLLDEGDIGRHVDQRLRTRCQNIWLCPRVDPY